jgi:hypothetical protein
MDTAPVDPWLVERLVADPGAARTAEEQALAALFAALRAPAAPSELAGQEQILGAFDAVQAQALRTTVHQPRTKSMRSALAVKSAVAAAVLAMVTVATVAVAATGTLPASLQGIAHRAGNAPAPDGGKPTDHPSPNHPTAGPSDVPSARPTPSAVGPIATAEAARGLCTAYLHGGLATTSTAYRNLAAAAGGGTRINAFCGANASSSGKPTGSPSTGHTARPSVTPPPHPTDHPTGKPAEHPTGPPSGLPTPTH